MNRPLACFTTFTTLFLAAAAAAQVQAFPMAGQRASTGLFYFDRKARTSPGQIFIHFGQPAWKEGHEKVVTGDKAAKLRLGKDWWTTLDATMPLTIGGTKVPAGIYYLGLSKLEKDKWQLMLLDPKEVRKQKKGPHQTAQLTAKLSIDLIYRRLGKLTDKLEISIKASKSDPRIGSLGIHWGNHFLRAQVEVEFGAKKKAVEAGGKKDKNANKDKGAKKDQGADRRRSRRR